jgi:hypothetical protein
MLKYIERSKPGSHRQNYPIKTGGRKRAKRTNQKEYEIYNNPDGLQDVILLQNEPIKIIKK